MKEGELVSLDNLEEEVRQRLEHKKKLDSITRQAEGLRVVHGIKGEEVQSATADDSTSTPGAQTAEEPAPAAVSAPAPEYPAVETPVAEAEKPVDATSS